MLMVRRLSGFSNLGGSRIAGTWIELISRYWGRLVPGPTHTCTVLSPALAANRGRLLQQYCSAACLLTAAALESSI